eukprot:9486773-Pyramimonas_sp.AAC.1
MAGGIRRGYVWFSSYAPNAVERNHRLIKDVLDVNHEHSSVADIICRVCNALSFQVNAGCHNGSMQHISKPGRGLHHWPTKNGAQRTRPMDAILMQPQNFPTSMCQCGRALPIALTRLLPMRSAVFIASTSRISARQ